MCLKVRFVVFTTGPRLGNIPFINKGSVSQERVCDVKTVPTAVTFDFVSLRKMYTRIFYVSCGVWDRTKFAPLPFFHGYRKRRLNN
jgi:hypothetical protein